MVKPDAKKEVRGLATGMVTAHYLKNNGWENYPAVTKIMQTLFLEGI
jgi:hypothetical protein